MLWNWRDASNSVAYASMIQQFRKLEAKAKVPTIKGRGFHAFRRTPAISGHGAQLRRCRFADR